MSRQFCAHTGAPGVFISYASQDACGRQCHRCSAGARQDLNCWIAPRDVKPGAEYADAIVRAMNNAKAIVLVMSGGAVASDARGSGSRESRF